MTKWSNRTSGPARSAPPRRGLGHFAEEEEERFAHHPIPNQNVPRSMDQAGPTTPYPAGRQAPPSGPGVTPGGRGWGASTSVKSASPVADGDPLVSSNPALDCKAHYADPLAGGVGMGRVADEVATTCAAQKGSRTVGRTSPSAPSVGGDSALKRGSTIRRWQGGQGPRAACRRSRRRAGRSRKAEATRGPGGPDHSNGHVLALSRGARDGPQARVRAGSRKEPESKSRHPSRGRIRKTVLAPLFDDSLRSR